MSKEEQSERNVEFVKRDAAKDEVTLEVKMTFERASIPSSHSNWSQWLDEASFHGVKLDKAAVIKALGGSGPV